MIFEENIYNLVSNYYSKNKENREKLRNFRRNAFFLRDLKIPIYKRYFDGVYSRSYYKILDRLIGEFKPKVVFEWGPGLNTKMFARGGAEVYSVEHDRSWYDTYKGLAKDKTHLVFSELSNESQMNYPDEILNIVGAVDMTFVDARCRIQCIESSKKKGVPITVMHDSLHSRTMTPAFDGTPPVSNEKRYCKEGYTFYKYFVEIVDHRTIVLMDDEKIFDTVKKMFGDFYIEYGLTTEYESINHRF